MKSESQNKQFEAIIDLATILSEIHHYEEILPILARKITDILHVKFICFSIGNPSVQRTIRTVYSEGKELVHHRLNPFLNHIICWILREKKFLLIADITQDSRFNCENHARKYIKSVLGVPLRRSGITFGALVLLNGSGIDTFGKSDLIYLQKIAIISAPFLYNVHRNHYAPDISLPNGKLLMKYSKLGLLGKSRQFVSLLKTVDAAARCDVRVLLQGESGTGKEVIAKAIHQMSARKENPFIAIDCGAIPQNLLESEFFGHVKGAFTGATFNRKGLFEKSNHGTLFIDEIMNLSLEMQSKFLRVLQESEIRPVGSDLSHPIDVRVITATSVSLGKMIENHQFREDLFYRLYVYPISVPSLAERTGDICELADYFLKNFASQQGKIVNSYDPELIEFMKNRQWLGNIRELENFVERLVTLASPETNTLTCEILPLDLKKELEKMENDNINISINGSFSTNLAQYEKKLLHDALIKYKWNQAKAARALKIPAQTMAYKMHKLGIKNQNLQ